jgi:acyl-coenzyme A thioesterase PaaI-like protein
MYHLPVRPGIARLPLPESSGENSVNVDTSLKATTESSREPDEYWRARRELAREVAMLANQLFSRDSSQEDIRDWTRSLKKMNASLELAEHVPGRQGWIDRKSIHGHDNVSIELSPLIGKSSVMAPPLKVWIENGGGRGEVFFDWRFEGPIRCVHGGFIAAVFDEFLGWAQMLSGGSGATKNLSITYHQPTPLNTSLELRAILTEVEGRKIRVQGELLAGDTLTASADGLFIHLDGKGTSELYKNL